MTDFNAGALYIPVRPDLVGFQQQLAAQATAAGNAAGAAMTTALSSRLRKASATLSNAGRSLTRYVSLPILGIGYAATKTALSYDKAFTKILAVTNIGRKQVEEWRQAVLDLSKQTARSPDELAHGLYFLASAGLEVDQVMETLEVSAKAAAAGLGETGDIARLTANVLNAYPKAGLKAIDVVDNLTAAVKAGTAEPDEFANAMGRLLPLATKAEVGFDELSASLATVSNIGLDVNEGVTAMRGLIRSLVAPTNETQETMKELGLSTDRVREVLADDGLLAALDLLYEKSNGQVDVLQDLVPNIRALTGFFGLTEQEASKVNEIFEDVANSTGELNKAFETTTRSRAFKFDKAMNQLRIAGIRLGNQLIPIIINDVVPAIQDLVKWFENLSPAAKDFAVKGAIAAALAGPFLRLAGAGFRLAAGLAKVVPWLLRLGKVPPVPPGIIPGFGGGGGTLPAPPMPTGIPVFGTGAPSSPIGPPIVAGRPPMGGMPRGGGIATPFSITIPPEEVDIISLYSANLEGLGVTAENLETELARAQEAIAETGSTTQVSAEAFQYAAEQGISYSAALKAVANGAKAGTPVVEDNNKVFQESADLSKAGARMLNQQLKAYQDLTGHGLKPVTIQMAKNLIAAGDAQGGFELLHDRVLAASRRIRDNVDASTDGAQSARELRSATTSAGKAFEEGSTKADKLTFAIKAVPKSAITRVVAETATAAARIQAFKELLQSVPNSVTVVGKVIAGVGRDLPGDAAGNWYEPRHGGYVRRIAEGGEAEGVFNERQVKALHAMGIRDGRGGAKGGDGGTTRLVVLEGRVDVDTGRIRAIAREESDGDRRHAKALGRMR